MTEGSHRNSREARLGLSNGASPSGYAGPLPPEKGGHKNRVNCCHTKEKRLDGARNSVVA